MNSSSNALSPVSILNEFKLSNFAEVATPKILSKPILGHGVGTSRLIGQNIILNIPKTNQEIYPEGHVEIKGGIPLHPHNNFLEIWLELGLLGILMLSFIWIKIW